jgi:K+-sensing histidine kinase KdpD
MPDTDLEQLSLSPFKLFEIDFELIDTRAERIKKIRWIIRLRFAISAGVVALMFFTGWQGLTTYPALTRPAFLAVVITSAVAVVLNIIYRFALHRSANLSFFVSFQLLVDVLIFTSYVYRTGGVTSPFTFLYLLPIIVGAILVSGRAAFVLAVLSSLCYVLLAGLAAMGLLPHVSYFVALDVFVQKWSYVTMMVLVNPFGFFTVAALSSFLMSAVRRRTESLAESTMQLDLQAHRLNMLYQVSRSAVAATDQDDVVGEIGWLLVNGLNLDRVLFYLVDGKGENLMLAREFYHPRLKDEQNRKDLRLSIPLKPEAGVTARCALDREAVNVADPSSFPGINQELAEKVGINPFAVAPMVANRELVGVLGVDRKFEQGVIADADFEVLKAFADQAAVALRTARMERLVGEKAECLADEEST